MLARGAEPSGTPAIGGDGRLAGFDVEAGSAGRPTPLAVGCGIAVAYSAGPGSLPPSSPGLPAIGGDGRPAGFGVEAGAGSAGFAGWLYAVAGSVVADGGSGSAQVGSVPECL